MPYYKYTYICLQSGWDKNMFLFVGVQLYVQIE